MDIIVIRQLGLRILINCFLLFSLLSFSSCQSEESQAREQKRQVEMDEYKKLAERLREDVKYCRSAVYKLSLKNSETLDPKRKGEIITEIKRYAKRVKRNKQQLDEIKMKMLQLQGAGYKPDKEEDKEEIEDIKVE